MLTSLRAQFVFGYFSALFGCFSFCLVSFPATFIEGILYYISGIVRKLVIQRGRQLISTGDQRRIIIWNLSVAKTMQSVIATNSSESTDRKQLLFRSDPQRVLQPLITDAGIDSEKEAIVLHRNPISIDSLFVDDFSVFIGSPDYPGSVGAILFW